MNHNFGPPSNPDDEDNETPAPERKPLPVRLSSFDMLLNRQKIQQEQEAASLEHEDDDDDEESESKPIGPRRSKVARMIRGIFKGRRPEATSAPVESAQPVPQAPVTERPTIVSPTPMYESPILDQASQASNTQETVEAAAVPDAPVEVTHITTPEAPSVIAAHETPEPATRAEQPAPTPIATAVAAASSRIASARTQAVNREAPQQAATANIADYLPPSLAQEIQHPANQEHATVAKKGGIAAPLTAFLAANQLSKRRRAESKSEIKELKSEVQDLDTRKQSESQRLSAIESSIRTAQQQPRPATVEKPRPRVAEQAPIAPERPLAPIAETVATVAAVIAEQPMQERKPQPQLQKSAEQLPQQAPTEQVRYEKPQKSEVTANIATQPTIEKSQEQPKSQEQNPDVATRQEKPKATPQTKEVSKEKQDYNEQQHDRKYEVMDEPSQQGTRESLVAPTPTQSSAGATQHATTSAVIPHPTASTTQKIADEQLYKQSMKTGFLIGLIVIVVGLIAIAIL